MTQHTQIIPNGLLHYSTVDATFEFEGRKCFMEVHRYCGPFFYYERTEEEMEQHYKETGIWQLEIEIEPDGTERFDKLWTVYYDWCDKNKNYNNL